MLRQCFAAIKPTVGSGVEPRLERSLSARKRSVPGFLAFYWGRGLRLVGVGDQPKGQSTQCRDGAYSRFVN
jgi:hypothetical protein